MSSWIVLVLFGTAYAADATEFIRDGIEYDGQVWPDVSSAWNNYKNTYEKQYPDDMETARRTTWVENLEIIDTQNAKFELGESPFMLGMSAYADQTNAEFQSQRRGYMHDEKERRDSVAKAPVHVGSATAKLGIELPERVDWREHGMVTPVQQQGTCSACYSFTTTGALEAQLMKTTGKLVKLSEQNVIDCSKKFGNRGCIGGLYDKAFRYISQGSHGIDTEASYKYEGRDDQPCRYTVTDRATGDTGFVVVPKNDEQALKDAVAHVGPVAAAFDTTHHSFMLYRKGVYYEPACSSTKPNHAMLIVGYGDACKENEEWSDKACKTGHGKYWLVKNSWGPEWGDKGYIRIARDSGSHCCVAFHATYPLMKGSQVAAHKNGNA